MIINFQDLINSLPDEIITGKLIKELKLAYECEIEMLKHYSNQAKKPEASLLPFKYSGSQFISKFWVNDLFLPYKNQFNWHLQNISQWLYAGCILVQNGRVSRHH